MNRKELFMKKRKIATILLAACLLLGNVSVANAASIDNGNKVHFNTEDNDTDLTLLQSKIATEEVTCDFTDATNDGASAYADTRRVSNKYMWSANIRTSGGQAFKQVATTPLKALLKLIIALSEAGELK